MIARLLLLISFILLLGVKTEAREVRQTPGVYYVLVDASHLRYSELIITEQETYDDVRPGNNLSVYLNNAGTQALIKIIGADSAWGDSALATSGVVVRIYTKAEHGEVLTLMQTSAWVRSEN